MQQARVKSGLGKRAHTTTEVAVQRHNYAFAQRVNGWICNLCKALVEKIGEGTRLVRERGQRRIIAHAPYRLFVFGQHGAKHKLNIFVRIAEEPLEAEQTPGARGCVYRWRLLRKLREAHEVCVQPLLVGLALCQCCLDLGIAQDYSLPGIDSDHFTWSQTTPLNYFVRLAGHYSRLRSQDQESM